MTQPFPGPKEHDLTGRHFSWLTVLGYAGPSGNSQNGSKWVCQCVCGRYENRNSRALKKQRSGRDYFCQACEDEINRSRHQKYLERTGQE